ncbi:hypothetical protein [Oligoflexus tunisiensis]|uniref:hypothetical protein n=1 Tax=Oligoflexus tunisiensis TaxID=708132 RepID=UPI00114CD8B4|nr:hypothetical protein [Oligoflexus tunisiensis]
MKRLIFITTVATLWTSRSLAAPSTCLPVASETDLVAYIAAAPFALKANAGMKIWETDSKEWQAARQAALAWADANCEKFVAAAQTMAYEASLLRDATSGHSYWVLRENKNQPAYQGVFAFRAPEEVKQARGLVIDAPHMGSDYATADGRAVRTFRDTDAVAFLQNTAHRCSLTSTSGCSPVTSSYACGEGGVRNSDVVHSIRNGYYAVYDGIESARDYYHLEYHGAGKSTNASGCMGTAHISQASSLKLTAEEDDGTWPNRFWRSMEQNLGAGCVCYHQRESGCKLNGGASTPGRRTNAEWTQSEPPAANACLVSPSSLAMRFIHFEGYRVDEAAVVKAIKAAFSP